LLALLGAHHILHISRIRVKARNNLSRRRRKRQHEGVRMCCQKWMRKENTLGTKLLSVLKEDSGFPF